jgi:site-specific DNA recombinase
LSNQKRATARGEQGIAYYRVSSTGQVNTDYDPEGISLPAQRVASKERARELGIALVDEYIDPGKSGKTIDQRPAFQEMIARIKADRTIKHVFVYALSRFARNRYDDAIMMMTLERLGVQLHSATEKNLDASPAGQAMHGMIAVFNEYQVRVSGEDIKYKMGQKAIKGGTISTAPLGYRNVREQFDGREVRTVALDPERAPLIILAFELYATGKYNFHTLRDALTVAGLRTKPTKRWSARPVSVHKIGELLRDRYYLGFISYDGEEYQGRHEPLVSQELFDQVQRVLYAERRAGTRQRVHNHYLKGLIFCDRCQRRLIITPGKSKSGAQYFYYICRGRQDKSCDLPYMPVADAEDAIERHYSNVQLSPEFCAVIRHRLDAAMASTTDSTRRLRTQYERQLKELNAREDGLLELVGDPDWPKEKLTAKMRGVREERTQLEARLAESDLPLNDGYEVLTTVLRLLEDPQALYRQSSIRARKVLNKAIFARLYLDAVHAAPVVAGDDLNEPFAATVAARRAWSLGEAVDGVLAGRGVRVAPARESGATLVGDAASTDLADTTALLNIALAGECSSSAVVVEVAGIEPASSGTEPGLLRAEPAACFSAPSDTQAS